LVEYTVSIVESFPFSLGIYIASIVFLEAKQFHKNKKITSIEEKEKSLDAFLKDGILSQEEYDCAKKRLDVEKPKK
jgi:hypothetical protein